MDLLPLYVGKDILSIIKSFIDDDEWYYLTNNWEAIEYPIDFAIVANKISLLYWCFQTNTPNRNDLLYAATDASYNGHNDMVKFLVSKGCVMTRVCYVHAHERGDGDMIKWLWENDCPIDADYVMDILNKYDLDM